VKINVIRDLDILNKEYPLMMAVARASVRVERHRPCVIRIEYTGEGEIDETLLLAGKGVTYDTGGVDLKVGGVMSGMSRDKCGASNIAGFLLTTSILSPPKIRVIAELGMVRNSIGSDSYLSDEIITSHAKVRVKIANTDAEGKLVLADLLSHLRIDALKSPNPHIFSMATLTGHVMRTYGPYTGIVENVPSKKSLGSKNIQDTGSLWGDPFEISSLRKEDFIFVKPKNNTFDVLQSGTLPSNQTNRGHQFPTAFLIIASGLKDHGLDSEHPLRYIHLDIAGSATESLDYIFGKCTACCLVTLTALFVFPRLRIK